MKRTKHEDEYEVWKAPVSASGSPWNVEHRKSGSIMDNFRHEGDARSYVKKLTQKKPITKALNKFKI